MALVCLVTLKLRSFPSLELRLLDHEFCTHVVLVYI